MAIGHLLIATPLYPPELGGPATYAKILEDELPSQEIAVTLVKFADVRMLPKVVRHVAYGLRVFKELRAADAVLALDPVSVGLPALLAALVLRKPFFLKIGGDYAWEQGRQRFSISEPLDTFVREHHVPFQVSVLRAVQSFVARQAIRVIAPSQYLGRIVATWGVPPEQIRVVYNAVQSEVPETVSASVAALARPRVVVAGRLVPWKGVGGVIDAMVEVRKQVPHATLVIVGDGPDRTSLESYAAARLPGAAFFTGALSHAEVLATIQDADVFVLNSTYEGLSHLLIEAASLGTPIVATAVGGNSEVIEDGVSGLLVASGDREALAAAMSFMLQDARGAARLADGARASGARFSVATMITGLKSVLAE